MERLRRAGSLEKVRGTRYRVIDSPVGPVTLAASPEALVSLTWGDRSSSFVELTEGSNSIISTTERQLREYFAGKRRSFEIPLAPDGTDFQKRVWMELLKIHYGQSISYGEQALRLGNPNAARAVGAANGKNPLCIIVPCHRVLGASGALTGFAGGIEAKRALLALEGNFR